MTPAVRQGIRRTAKRALDGCAVALVAPAAWSCAIETKLSAGEAVFAFWTQLLAMAPGLPGVFLRRAFYRLTLEQCDGSFYVGFGALFSHRRARIAEDAYIGPYAIIGSARLGRGCLIGSRASIVSGGELHALDSQNRWTAADLSRLRQVDIGAYAWVGEACLVMANVGRSAQIAAGAVVSSPVPPGVVVAGNPARFVRRLIDLGDLAPQEEGRSSHAAS